MSRDAYFITENCFGLYATCWFITRGNRSRRDAAAWAGRTDTNKRVVFDDVMIASSSSSLTSARAEMGSYVAVRVESSNGITLRASKPR